jgi:hypothetical protein
MLRAMNITTHTNRAKRSFWWTLNGGNHQVLATSEQYSSNRAMLRAATKAARMLKLKVTHKTH